MASDILSRIVEDKKEQVGIARRKTPENLLRTQAGERTDFRSFTARFSPGSTKQINIIAEIKRASPSKGIIRPGLDAAHYASAYEKGGAAALSVLTETKYFNGSIDDLKAARESTDLPVLRKDFIISEYQIYESSVILADAILLIVRVLSDGQLSEYLDLCRNLGIDALVEIHTPEDLERASAAGANLIGINNRNLRSFDTDIRTAMEMVSRFLPGQIPVAASGISSRADIIENKKAGITNFLIGETLVRTDDPEETLKKLRGC